MSSTAVDVPPRKPKRSTSSVRAPLRAAATAAVVPAEPAPITSTSTSLLICARVCTNEQIGNGRGGASLLRARPDAAADRRSARRLALKVPSPARARPERRRRPFRDRRACARPRRPLARTRGAFRARDGAGRRERRRRCRRVAAPPAPPAATCSASWGETLASLVRRLPPAEGQVPVVQICGAIEGLVPGTGPTEVAALYAAWTVRAVSPAAVPRSPTPVALRRADRRDHRDLRPLTVALVGIGARTDGAGPSSYTSSTTTAASSRMERSIAPSAWPIAACDGHRGRGRPPEAARRCRGIADGPVDVLSRRRLRPVRAAMTTAVVTGARGGSAAQRSSHSSTPAFSLTVSTPTTRFRARRSHRALICAHGISGRSQGDGPVDARAPTRPGLVLDRTWKSVFLYAKQRFHYCAATAAADRHRRFGAGSSARTRTSRHTSMRRRRQD